MTNNRDKKQTIIDMAAEIQTLSQNEVMISLMDKLNAEKANYALDKATSWEDFKFRMGVLTGLSLFEEKTGLIIQAAERFARGKMVGQ